jgi:hypothetical protein
MQSCKRSVRFEATHDDFTPENLAVWSKTG